MIAVFLYISCYDVTVLQCYIGVKKTEYAIGFLVGLGKYQEVFEKGLHVLKTFLGELEEVSRCVCDFFRHYLFVCLK